MRRRILFLEVLPTISGGQRALLDLAPGLAEYELHALLPDRGPLQEALEGLMVTCHYAEMPQFTLVRKNAADALHMVSSLPRLALHTAALVKRLDIDLIYANNGRAFIWGTPGAILARRPIVWQMHNVLGDAKSVRLIRLLGHTPVVRRVYAVSENAAKDLDPLDKTAIIPLGVDTDLFRPNPAARLKVRQELGLAEHVPCIGCIADLIPLKGQDTLLKAARNLPEMVIVLVGQERHGDEASRAYADRLRAEAGDNVRFLGQRSDIPDLLNALDLLAICSTTETGPRVLLEALACGLPVLSTPVGRAPELIQEDQTGALLPTGDATLLTKLARHLIGAPSLLEAMRARSRSLALEQLTLETYRRRMSEDLSEIVNLNKRH